MSDLQDALRLASGASPWKPPCRVVATSAITTSGLQTIDGVDLNRGDRVLRAAQEDASENGIYVASAGRWSRASETAIDNFVMAGMTVRVLEGDTGKGLWTMTAPTTGPFVLGTTELTFEQDASDAIADELGTVIASSVMGILDLGSVNGAQSFNGATHNIVSLVATDNVTLTLSNLVTGKDYSIDFTQDSTGGRTLLLAGFTELVSGAFAPNPAPDSITILTFRVIRAGKVMLSAPPQYIIAGTVVASSVHGADSINGETPGTLYIRGGRPRTQDIPADLMRNVFLSTGVCSSGTGGESAQLNFGYGDQVKYDLATRPEGEWIAAELGFVGDPGARTPTYFRIHSGGPNSDTGEYIGLRMLGRTHWIAASDQGYCQLEAATFIGGYVGSGYRFYATTNGFTVGGVSGANQNGAMKLVLGTPSGNPDVDSLYMYADYALKKLKLLWPDGTVTTI